jgi:maleate cis-trans isomerase
MYGHRARVGYACPPPVAEVFVYEFYRIAPPGVTLAISTVGGGRSTRADLQESFRLSVKAAEELARTGVDSIILGGEPLNGSMGAELDEVIQSLQDRFGIPVSTSLTSMTRGLEALGARRVGVVGLEEDGDPQVEAKGAEVVVQKGAGFSRPNRVLAKIPIDIPSKLVREAKAEHPDIDTVKIGCAHWATVDAIDGLEKDLDIGIVSSSLAITWQALRLAKVDDPIENRGRLLREH